MTKSDEAKLSHAAEHNREIDEYFGSPPRFDIRMFPLFGEDRSQYRIVIPATTAEFRDVVEQIAYQFKRETRYDFVPFDAASPEMYGALFSSQKFLATCPIASGAAGFSQQDGSWWMDWIWIHPYERGYGLLRKAWPELEERYSEFKIRSPYSHAMCSFIRNYGISLDRLDSPLDEP